MKIFIICLGLLLVNVSVVSYKGNYAKYIHLHRMLDNIAFEAAEMAARGADAEEAQWYAEELLRYTIQSLKNTQVSSYRCEVYYEDGFAVALIRVDVKNLFRFPFSPVTSVIAERKIYFANFAT